MLFTYELNSENWISNSIGKDSFMFFSISIKSISVAMKIENGPKHNANLTGQLFDVFEQLQIFF